MWSLFETYPGYVALGAQYTCMSILKWGGRCSGSSRAIDTGSPQKIGQKKALKIIIFIINGNFLPTIREHTYKYLC